MLGVQVGDHWFNGFSLSFTLLRQAILCFLFGAGVPGHLFT
jgi:hypothetical protein